MRRLDALMVEVLSNALGAQNCFLRFLGYLFNHRNPTDKQDSNSSPLPLTVITLKLKSELMPLHKILYLQSQYKMAIGPRFKSTFQSHLHKIIMSKDMKYINASLEESWRDKLDRRSAAWRYWLVLFVLAIAITIPRRLALNRPVTPDEHLWLARSANFYIALAQGIWRGHTNPSIQA
jgi:hypothetical protein